MEYYAGFVWGLCDTLAGFLNLVQQVAGIFDLMFTIAESVDIWETLKEFAKAQWHTFLQHLGEAGKLDPFDQGEMAATIKVNLVLLVITILDLAEAAAQIAKAVGPALAAAKRAAGELAKLTQTGAGKVVEKIVNALERRGKKPIGRLADPEELPTLGEIDTVSQRRASEIEEGAQRVPKIRHVGSKGGITDETIRDFSDNELPTAEYIAEHDGAYVKARFEDHHSNVRGNRNADADINGVKVEFKKLDSGTENAVVRNVNAGMERKAPSGHPQSDRFVLDVRGTGLTE